LEGSASRIVEGAPAPQGPVDEIWVGSVTKLDGKPLQSIAKGEVDLDSEDDADLYCKRYSYFNT